MAMINPRMSDQPTWDKDDRELQSFLGLSLWMTDLGAMQPKLGAGVKAPLRKRSIETLRRLTFDPEHGSFVGDEEETEEVVLTPPRLAWHFGHMDWTEENIKDLLRKSRGTIQGADLDERWFFAAESRAVDQFRGRRVTRLVRAAFAREQPLYVQWVPTRVLEEDLPESKFFTHVGELGLCVLPVTVKVAEFFHRSESDIRLYAPQVLWVVNHRCVTKTIHTPEQLAQAINGWHEIVDPKLLSRLNKKLQRNRPELLAGEATRLLLRGGEPDDGIE